MDSFMTWDILLSFSGLVGAVYTITEFTKELKLIKKIPTKYWSFFIALILLISTNLVMSTFDIKDIILYLLNAIIVSLSSNGLYNFNEKEEEW